MKVSVNWLRQFTDIDISVDELVHKIGVQLGAVEEVADLGRQYEGIIVARIESCEKHPNADKLSICKINDGGKATDVARDENGLVQVVCGAPNVRDGLLVAWLPPGATVPSTFDKDPFVLEARELRGEVSNGMLASASELAIGDDHSGIVELDVATDPGADFATLYGLDDHIIDIENKMFTHRPDCFGLLGVAREVAGIQGNQFVSPDWYVQALDRIKPGATKLELSVTNTTPELVPRFTAVALADVTVGPSPFALQTYLARVGLRPINNIVDVTNYIMYLTGQPTHAYDADKLQQYGNLSLETRLSRAGDELTLLNGKQLRLQDDTTILITSNDVPVGVAGCMGGADTEVDATTKNIVLECANFDMYSIRRTSMKYGLFTDAVTRFNKGQSPLQNDVVLEELVTMMQSLTHGHVASQVFDLKSDAVSSHDSVQVTTGFINSRLGTELSDDAIVTLLRNVEFSVQKDGDILDVTPPYWRTDIEISEDLVEEVGRLYGYDRLPLVLPRRDLTPVIANEQLTAKRFIRDTLSTAGANEVLTYGFVHGDLFNKVGQDADQAFRISNALSPDLQYYRLSLTPSLLDKVHANIKAGFSEFALFEIGKTHTKTAIDDDGLPKEFDRVSLVYAVDDKHASSKGSAYYVAKTCLESLYGEGLTYKSIDESGFAEHPMFSQLLAPFEPLRSAVVFTGELLVGVVGEYRSRVRKSLKLPVHTAGFEGFLSAISHEDTDVYTPVSRFPKVQQDISLRVPSGVSYQDLRSVIDSAVHTLDNTVATLEPLDIYQGDDTSMKQVSFRLTIGAYDRTLTAEAVNQLLDTAAAQAATLGAQRL